MIVRDRSEPASKFVRAKPVKAIKDAAGEAQRHGSEATAGHMEEKQ